MSICPAVQSSSLTVWNAVPLKQVQSLLSMAWQSLIMITGSSFEACSSTQGVGHEALYGTLYHTVDVFFSFLLLSFVVIAHGLTAQGIRLVGFARNMDYLVCELL